MADVLGFGQQYNGHRCPGDLGGPSDGRAYVHVFMYVEELVATQGEVLTEKSRFIPTTALNPCHNKLFEIH